MLSSKGQRFVEFSEKCQALRFNAIRTGQVGFVVLANVLWNKFYHLSREMNAIDVSLLDQAFIRDACNKK